MDGLTNFDSKVRQSGGAVNMLRTIPPYTYPFTYRSEYTSWLDEQYAWKHAVTMFDQSHHMMEVFFSGPDLKRLFSNIGINGFSKFVPGSAKQIVCVAESGHVIGDAILFAFDENTWSMCGTPAALNWASYIAQTRGYDVEVSADLPTLWNRGQRRFFRFQLNGPLSQRLLEAAQGSPIDRIKFFHMGKVTVAGTELHALNHTMAGAPGEEMTGFELIGPLDSKQRVHAALLEAGRAFGLREGGSRAYLSAGAESGWVPLYVPAIYTGQEMVAYREWLSPITAEGSMPLTGSFDSTQVEDYYFSPWDLGYSRLIRFDHDFIGRNALEAASAMPKRRKVYLRWNETDALALMRSSLFGGDRRAKMLDLPNVAFGTLEYDSVMQSGRMVGLSTWGSYTENLRAIVTLGIVEEDVANGDEVTIVWGEAGGAERRPFIVPHQPFELRATVCATPFAADA